MPTEKEIRFCFINQTRDTYNNDAVATFESFGLLRKEKVKKYFWTNGNVRTERRMTEKEIDCFLNVHTQYIKEYWHKVESSEVEEDVQ